MKGSSLLIGPIAVLVGLCMGNSARAAYCGACCYPAAPICTSQCEMPVVKYRVSYQSVVETQTKVCYRPVYQTVMEEQHYTVCKQVYEQCFREDAIPSASR